MLRGSRINVNPPSGCSRRSSQGPRLCLWKEYWKRAVDWTERVNTQDLHWILSRRVWLLSSGSVSRSTRVDYLAHPAKCTSCQHKLSSSSGSRRPWRWPVANKSPPLSITSLVGAFGSPGLSGRIQRIASDFRCFYLFIKNIWEYLMSWLRYPATPGCWPAAVILQCKHTSKEEEENASDHVTVWASAPRTDPLNWTLSFLSSRPVLGAVRTAA